MARPSRPGWTSGGPRSVTSTSTTRTPTGEISDGTSIRRVPRPTDDRHFHPPPAASDAPEGVEPSCIEVSEVFPVARAVLTCWRQAYDRGDFEECNAVDDPP